MAVEKRNFIQEAADRQALREALRWATLHNCPLTLTEAQVALLDRTLTEDASRCECGRCHLRDA